MTAEPSSGQNFAHIDKILELSIRNTAANNRLEALCLLGFVERKRSGRRWFYFFVRGEVVA